MTQKGLRIEGWSLAKIASAVDGRLVNHRMAGVTHGGVCSDTRQLSEGEIFVALVGERFDGHRFVGRAVELGASAVMVESAGCVDELSVAAIVVDDTTKALGRLGHGIFLEARQEGMGSVAVTGSNGKTTTKEILSTLWGLDGEVWATPGNLNNHIGVPLTLCAIPRRCDHLIVEMGANHRGEIAELIRLAPADQRVITSIGRAHLEGFGSMQGVRKAKSEILEVATGRTRAVVPQTERRALEPPSFPGTLIGVGTELEAEMRIRSVGVTEDDRRELAVSMTFRDRRWRLRCPLVGEHNAWNLATALATMAGQPFATEDGINEALAGLEIPGGRWKEVQVGSTAVIDDAYNANPASVRASLEACRNWAQGQDVTVVIGEMKELGSAAEKEHRSLGQWVGRQGWVGSVIFYGEYASLMAEEAERQRGGASIEATDDLEQAARWLQQERPDRLFLKGSRANRLELLVDMMEQGHR